MHRFWAIFGLILLAAFAPGISAARSDGPLTVVSDDNYPPYIFREPDGKLSGYLVDAWSLWESKTGRRVNLVATDWEKALGLMASGQADVIDTMFRTPERERLYDFTPQYATIPVPVYVHSSIGGITNSGSLRGFLIGAKSGDACIDRLKASGVDSIKTFDSYVALVDAAVASLVKIFCLDEPPADYLLYKANADQAFHRAFVLYNGALHRAVRKGDRRTLDLVTAGFDAFTESEQRALRDKWMGSRKELPALVLRIAYALLAATVAGVILGAWGLSLRHQVRRRTRELDQQQRQLRTLVETIPDLIWLKDPEGVYLLCNPAFERFFGAVEAEIVGKTDFDFVESGLAEFFRQRDREAMTDGGSVVNEEWVTFASDGHRALLETIKTPMQGERGALVGVLGIARDITALKKAEAEIQQLAFYDPLTGLPNRRLLNERMSRAKALSARNGTFGGLLFIDMDNFKTLNDTRGHDIGDMLLKEVGQRLAACVRQGDTVARFGGDEFIVMVEEMSGQMEEAAAHADTVADKVLRRLAEPYSLGEQLYHCGASLGITLFRGTDHSNDDLLKQADLAMYQAKAAGKNTRRFFDPQMQQALAAQAALDEQLRKAVAADEFLLYYQPQVDREGRPVGAEGLIRWQAPGRGLVAPADFIPAAESSGLILPIGLRILNIACRQLVAWSASPATAHLDLAINVSARQFLHDGFVEEVRGALELSGANPARLKLELTESVLLRDVTDCARKMEALRALGVGLALDDFGTGYSSLAYLKRLPFGQLKIDRSFVRDILTDANDAAIARTVIVLGKCLNLTVLAEGVESDEQRKFLAEQGCDEMQGYLFGRPMPIESFMQWLGGF